MSLKKVGKPNEFVEVFISLVRWFLLFVLINNAIWAFVFICSTSSEEKTETHNEMIQDGYGNKQEMTNG